MRPYYLGETMNKVVVKVIAQHALINAAAAIALTVAGDLIILYLKEN